MHLDRGTTDGGKGGEIVCRRRREEGGGKRTYRKNVTHPGNGGWRKSGGGRGKNFCFLAQTREEKGLKGPGAGIYIKKKPSKGKNLSQQQKLIR